MPTDTQPAPAEQKTALAIEAAGAVPAPPPAPALTQVASGATLPTWPVAGHLSPAAVFEPGRVDICTRYQLAAVDATPTAGHVDAALHHLRSAADRIGSEDHARTASALRAVYRELNRIAQQLGITV